jgi:hypothetical protein
VVAALVNVDQLQNGSFPALFNYTDVPANDTLILKKAGIATADVINTTYTALSSNDTGTIEAHAVQQTLSVLLSVASVSYTFYDVNPRFNRFKGI